MLYKIFLYHMLWRTIKKIKRLLVRLTNHMKFYTLLLMNIRKNKIEIKKNTNNMFFELYIRW